MDSQEQHPDKNQQRSRGRIGAGLFLLVIGGLFLLREMDYPFFPDWFFTWPMILIAIGIFSGIKHGFRGSGWLIMLIVGGFFLGDQLHMGFRSERFVVPAAIIAVGLILILRPQHRRDWEGVDWWHRRRGRDWKGVDWWHRNWGSWDQPSTTYPPPPVTPVTPQPGTGPDQAFSSKEDYIDSTSVFGSVHKIVVSKNFKGGEITCFFGGAEIDLTQADITGTVVLDVTAVLGGAKLFLPGHWDVKSEISAVFGGIDDKRQVQGNLVDPNKVLLLKGTVFMGGIDIRSY